MDPFPLQFGIPGGPELLVILLISVLLFGVPLVIVVLALVAYRNRRGRGDRVAELEGRIDELERELRAERTGRSAGARRDGSGESAAGGQDEPPSKGPGEPDDAAAGRGRRTRRDRPRTAATRTADRVT